MIPLSFAQRRLWFLHQLEGPSPTYNIPTALRISGKLDRDALDAALGDVVERHESLRTLFAAAADTAHQVVQDVGARPRLTVVGTCEDEVGDRLAEATGFAFDLTADLPIRATLFDLGADEHVLLLLVHHVAGDGWSQPLLVRDLLTAYAARGAGQEPQWEPLPVQYADYTLWQREVLGAEDDPDSLISRQLRYWSTALAGLPEELNLPVDRTRPTVPSYRGDTVTFSVPADVHTRLAELARARQVSVFMVVQAALAVLLSRLGAGADIPIGTPIAGRTDEGLRDLIGLFVNTLVLRTDLSGDPTFPELLARVREANLAAYEHQDVPFERLVEVLNPPRAAARNPLFQTLVTWDNIDKSAAHDAVGRLAGARVSPFPADTGIARFDLSFTFGERHAGPGAPAGIPGSLTYATDLFDRGSVEVLVERFLRVLELAAADPGTPVTRWDVLSADERHQTLTGWNDTAAELPTGSFVDWFESSVSTTPDAPAVIFGDQVVSYAQLNTRVNRTARILADKGAGPGQFVAVTLPRSVDLLVSLLAVLKTGAAFLPIDVNYPADRVAHMLDDVAPVLTLSEPVLDEGGDPTNLARRVPAAAPAYVIFTSGSTGRPKGVVVPRAALDNFLFAMRRQLPLAAGDQLLAVTTIGFDIAGLELFLPLTVGATVVLADRDTARDPAALCDILDTGQITMMQATPSLWHAITTERPHTLTNTHILVGGEALPPPLAQTLTHHAPTVHNMYGPTETTIWSTTTPIHHNTPPHIGKPITNTQTYILDNNLQPTPPGTPGDLYIAGHGLAHGYHHQPTLTTQRFTANPYGPPGTRMYRTGDLAQWTTTGTLQYLGRTDNQIKLRGHRIEPQEIETALTNLPHITAAAITTHNHQLIAYLVTTTPTTTHHIRQQLATTLPDHMLPTTTIELPHLPLTDNGKLNRKALPLPDTTNTPPTGRPPRTPQEQVLCTLFAETLGRPITIDDDFFTHGGHSLLAMRLASRIRTTLGVQLEISQLFDSPTVAGLSAALGSAAGARPPLTAGPRPERLPLSFAQQRLWFLNRLDGLSPAYNVPVALRLTGPLDVRALEAAFADVTDRHETLRTVFADDADGSHQLVLPSVRTAVPVLPVAERELAERVSEVAGRGFDLAEEPPLRATVLRLAADRHVLVLVLHHIAGDGGWSAPVLVRDLLTAYAARTAGTEPDWKPLPVQYADYTLWQRKVLGSEEDPDSPISRQLSYWRQALDGLPDELALPRDRPRPLQAGHHGDEVPFVIPAELRRALDRTAAEQHVSIFMVVQAALAVLLSRLGAGADIPIGTPIAGRTDESLEDLVGFFLNILVLRTDLSGDPTFPELLARVREANLAAYEHQDVPFERLVEVLNPARSMARHPLFQVMLAFNNVDQQAALGQADRLGDLTVAGEPTGTGAVMTDLRFALGDSGDGTALTGKVEYATELFDRGSVEVLVERFLRVLELAAADPGTPVTRWDLLSADERHQTLTGWNDTAAELPTGSFVDWFESSVSTTPDAPAVIFGDQVVSYAELNTRVNQVARVLIADGAGPGEFVAVTLPRSVELVVSVLAVLKTGAAFLPIDVNYPADRVAYMLDDVAPVLTLSTPIHNPGGDTANPDVRVPGSAPAYVIFTSGSTGRPKGVVVPRVALDNFLYDMRERFPLTTGDRLLAVTTVGFDIAGLELLLPLVCGAAVVLTDQDTARDPAALCDILDTGQITMMQATPSLWHAITTERPHTLTNTHILVGGEALPPPLAQTLTHHAPTVHNMYGPTETTIWSTTTPIHHNTPPHIGKPITNTQTYILDNNLQPTPPGTPGDLYIAGHGLAHGYHHQPTLTTQRFTANPYGPPGTRMYRTGDLAQWTTTGTLQYLGRTDNQIKLRGHRIEPQEIETALTNLPHITAAAITTHNHQLIAYLVTTTPTTTHHIRQQLATTLPDHMLPTTTIELPHLPLTDNGKLNRKALPPPPETTAPSGRAPRTAHERILQTLFAETLGQPAITIDDDFFTHGGHSLLAMRLASRIRTTLGVQIVVRDLFQASTVAKLAAVIGDARGARPALAAGRRPERVPLSSAQQRLWFLHRMEGPTPTYNLASALRLTGELDLAALEAAFGDVVNRHESLRTVFADDADGSHQIVLDDVRPPFSVAPATDLDDDLRAAARHSFDLSREIPIRMSVFRTGPDEWVALLLMHHIASDGWSMPVLADDLTSAYGARRAGREPDWEPLPVQYADFALWQRGLLEGEQEGQLAYWRRALAGLPEEISLPTDRPRPARGTQAGQVVRFDLPASLHAGLLDVAARTGTTAFMVVQAALAVVLSRLGAGTDIPIGTPIAGRADTALDKLVGFFVNTLVLRCDLTGDPTFTELLGRIREVDLDAYAHQDVPFERLVEELNPARSLARHPLFQTELLWQQQEPGRTAPGDLGGLRVADRPVHTGVARFDLSFALFAGADAGPVHGELLFSTDLFDRSTAESLVVRLTQALTAVAGEPDRRISRIELLTDQERRWLLTEWNDTGREVTTATLPALFEAQVARAPHAPAVSFGEVTWTYEELNARANQLARALIEHGVGPEDFVAVVLPRSPELVAGLMAVLKAGAAYFPVDPNLPPARVAYMLENVSPAAVLTTDLGGLSLPAGPGARIDVRGELTRPATDVRDDERTSRLSPLHPSYVIHTSGSTGRPKGVVMTTGAMVNVLEWHNRSVPGGPGTVTAQFAAVSFDVSVQEMLSALLYGKSLVACPEEIRRDPRELAAWMARHRVQELLSPNLVVDAVFEAAQEYGEDLSALGLVAQAGEALTLREHVRRFYSRWPGNQLHNQYGPTETQVVTAWPLPSDVADWPAVPPIGGPVDNTRLYVLDEGLMPVPVGVTGELYIAGAGLARGYHNRPGLTAERFVADPFDGRGARMYRSGDLVRHRPDGLLDFVGRADHQVKLRGFRIELGEIEQVLGGHPSVVRAAVLLTDDKRLVAYVVPAGGAEFGVDELRAHAQSALPDYMMPSVIVPIDSLPFTVNGKLDRRALPDVTAEPSRAGRRAPHGAREEILCGLFAEVLKVQDVGVDDNFFELGGHSMLVASLIRRVKAVLGLDLAVRTLFESPTVAELVEALATTRPDDPGAALRTMLPLRARGELTPLFCVHAGSGASWCYSGLMAQLDPQQPIYGLQARGIAEVEPLPSTVEEMAADYLAEIRKVQPHGPYRLLGWSFGGHAAHAIATLLQEQGEEVDLLVLVDSHPQGKESPRLSTSEIVAQQMRAVGFPFEEEELVEGAFPMERYLAHLRTYNNAFADLTDDQIVRMLDIYVNNVQLMRAFEPGLYRGDVLFFSAAPGGVKVADSARWQPYVRGLIDDHDIDSDHEGMFTRPEAVAAIGAILAKALAP